jgi:hypothetical protein
MTTIYTGLDIAKFNLCNSTWPVVSTTCPTPPPTAGGWPGDVPHSRMDASKIRKAGFNLTRSSDEAVRHAIGQILKWLATRKNAKDDLRLPADAKLVLSK